MKQSHIYTYDWELVEERGGTTTCEEKEAAVD